MRVIEIEGIPGMPKVLEPLYEQKVLPEYRKLAKKYAPQLERQGRLIVRMAFGKMYSGTVKALTEESEPTPEWVNELTDPVLGPFAKGVREESMKVVKPLLAASGGALVITAVGLFLLGRFSKRII